MSHELRAPMNAIIGFSQLLSMNIQKNLTTVEFDHINEIDNAICLIIINEILDLSKVESGQLSLNLELVELSQVMKEGLHLIIPLVNQRGISVTLS